MRFFEPSNGNRKLLLIRRAAILVATALLCAYVGSARADEVSDGWRAYIAGKYVVAEKSWLPLAEKGDPGASFGMGILSQTQGHLSEALVWYEQAARRGMTNAQVLVGAMYADGRGTPRDSVRAYAWLERAVLAGHPQADLARDAVGATLSPEEVRKAQALAVQLAKRP